MSVPQVGLNLELGPVVVHSDLKVVACKDQSCSLFIMAFSSVNPTTPSLVVGDDDSAGEPIRYQRLASDPTSDLVTDLLTRQRRIIVPLIIIILLLIILTFSSMVLMMLVLKELDHNSQVLHNMCITSLGSPDCHVK